MTDLKGRYLALCKENIHREGIDELLQWLVDSDFFVAPASTRYHGSYEGGLVMHSLNVYDCLKKLISYHGMEDAFSEESVVITSLFHDLCKVNFYKKGFRNVKDDATGQWYRKTIYEIDEKFPCGDHADKSLILVLNFMKLLPDEMLAIRSHMGGWDTAVKGGNPFVG